MRLAVAAAVLVVGCGDPRDCSIDAVEFDFAGSGVLFNCGELNLSISTADMGGYQAAQACVIDHAQRHDAFYVGWTLHFVETYQRDAYIGTTQGGSWHVSAFEQDAGGSAKRDSCTDLLAKSYCTTSPWDLCIECVGRKTADACTP